MTSLGIHYHSGTELADYLVDSSVFDFRDGYVARLTGPGLGIESSIDIQGGPRRW